MLYQLSSISGKCSTFRFSTRQQEFLSIKFELQLISWHEMHEALQTSIFFRQASNCFDIRLLPLSNETGTREQQRVLQPQVFRRPPDISDHQGQFSEPCQNRAAVWWRCGESASTEPDVGWATRPPRLLGEPASLLKQETFSSSRETVRSETHACQMGEHM